MNSRKEGNEIILTPPDYTAWINWSRLAADLPRKCYAALAAQKEKEEISLKAGAGRCVSEMQVVEAEAMQRGDGVSPMLAFALTLSGFVIGALSGVVTFLVLQK